MNKVLLVIFIVIIGALGSMLLGSQQPAQSPQELRVEVLPTQSPPSLLQKTPTLTPPSATFAATVVPNKPTLALVQTTKGEFVIFFHNDTPHTIRNFVEKAQKNLYNNLTFHRVQDWVVQGGDPKGDGTGGGTMPTELTNKPFVVGSVGVARGSDIRVSNDMQFFVTKKEATWLYAQYTNFGIVARGIDVVNKLEVGDRIVKVTVE